MPTRRQLRLLGRGRLPERRIEPLRDGARVAPERLVQGLRLRAVRGVYRAERLEATRRRRDAGVA